MRTASEVTAERDALLADYHERAQSMTVGEAEAISAKIKTARATLAQIYAAGANLCPKCNRPPVGMLRRPQYTDRGQTIPDLFEVGCATCRPVLVMTNGNPRRRLCAAQGPTPEQAVENWNAQKWVEDGKVAGLTV